MVCRWTGAIIASGAVRGSLNLTNNMTWLLPLWIQLLCPVIIAISILFLPESPRWLFVNHKQPSAVAIITKYHGIGNRYSLWVTLQEAEFRHYLKQNTAVILQFTCVSYTTTHIYRTNTGGTIAFCSMIELRFIVCSAVYSLPSSRSALAILFYRYS